MNTNPRLRKIVSSILGGLNMICCTVSCSLSGFSHDQVPSLVKSLSDSKTPVPEEVVVACLTRFRTWYHQNYPVSSGPTFYKSGGKNPNSAEAYLTLGGGLQDGSRWIVLLDWHTHMGTAGAIYGVKTSGEGFKVYKERVLLTE